MDNKQTNKKRKKLRKERIKSRKAALKSRYPRIVVLEDGEESTFREDVIRIARRFNFACGTCCDPQEKRLFFAVRQLGLRRFLDCLRVGPKEERAALMQSLGEVDEMQLVAQVFSHVGRWIFERLPKRYRDNPLPFYYYQARPREERIEISFEFLPRTSSPEGIIYASPSSPSVRFSGREYLVGFFRHAIERVCQRIIPSQAIGYADFCGCYRYFRHCLFYEPIELFDGQEAIRLFAPLSSSRGSAEHVASYMREVAGFDPEWVRNGKYYYVLGYCPVGLVNGYAAAKTFLLPGFRGTPEYSLIRSVHTTAWKRSHYLEVADGINSQTMLSGRGIELLRFFHRHGAEQVVRLRGPVFDNRFYEIPFWV